MPLWELIPHSVSAFLSRFPKSIEQSEEGQRTPAHGRLYNSQRTLSSRNPNLLYWTTSMPAFDCREKQYLYFPRLFATQTSLKRKSQGKKGRGHSVPHSQVAQKSERPMKDCLPTHRYCERAGHRHFCQMFKPSITDNGTSVELLLWLNSNKPG